MGGQHEACALRDEMVGPGKGVLKKSDLQKSSSNPKIHKGHTNLRLQDEVLGLQDEVLPTDETIKSLSPHQSHVRRVSYSSLNQDEEDYEEEEHEVDSFRDENIGSTSHGMSNTRKESRALNEAKKRRSKKANLVFEVDKCVGRIVGEDSQQLITKGGCVVRDHAKFDGTTWRNQTDLLKYDIISKCTHYESEKEDDPDEDPEEDPEEDEEMVDASPKNEEKGEGEKVDMDVKSENVE